MRSSALTTLWGNRQMLAYTLALPLLGTLLRWAVSPEDSLGSYLLGSVFLLLPVLVFVALALSQRLPGVRWGVGLGTGLGAAWANFVLLDPRLNEDANIGLGIYGIGGFVPVLGLPALLGAALGWALRPAQKP